jgi:hypothetical protein
MESKDREAHAGEKPETKNGGKNPSANPLQLVGAGMHKLFSVYWPNFIIGIIILLIGVPIALWLGSSRKNAIYASAAGLWILAGLICFGLARYITLYLDEGTPKIASVNKPKDDPEAEPSPSQTQAPTTIPAPHSTPDPAVTRSPKTPRLLPEPSATAPAPTATAKTSVDNRITNSPIVNSPGSVQAPGGNVTVNQAPPARHLTKPQRDRLFALLHSLPHLSVHILCMMGDTESITFADEFSTLFKQIGWTVTGPNPAMLAGNPKGLLLVVHSQDKAPTGAGDLQAALGSVGLPTGGEANAGYAEYSLTLVIGHRPN